MLKKSNLDKSQLKIKKEDLDIMIISLKNWIKIEKNRREVSIKEDKILENLEKLREKEKETYVFMLEGIWIGRIYDAISDYAMFFNGPFNRCLLLGIYLEEVINKRYENRTIMICRETSLWKKIKLKNKLNEVR